MTPSIVSPQNKKQNETNHFESCLKEMLWGENKYIFHILNAK